MPDLQTADLPGNNSAFSNHAFTGAKSGHNRTLRCEI